ncbi:peroxiredoxin [Picosynechococcus sp. NKBG15041c]|uniref:peroxiredoxin n=1 Tax=Picosynechococcus sp. NKBG15041c TaxID=1407650 RepID=UPI00042479D5
MLKFLRTTLIAVLAIACLWLPMDGAIALGGTQPTLDQPAPEFTLLGNAGDGEIQEFSLADYRGQWVVLYFYPQDFTPGCTLEARRFQQDLPQYLDRNVQILGVSVDDVDSHEAFCDAEGLKFPLLADSTGDVSKQYGSYLTGYSLRHTYLIDPDGVLRKIYLGVNPAIHSQEVLSDLDSLIAAA